MLRSAISRAYYAAFLLARNYLRDQDGDKAISKLSQVHIYVADKFSSSKNQVRQKYWREALPLAKNAESVPITMTSCVT